MQPQKKIKMKNTLAVCIPTTQAEREKKAKSMKIGYFAPMCMNKEGGLLLCIHILKGKRHKMQNDHVKFHQDSDVDLSQSSTAAV